MRKHIGKVLITGLALVLLTSALLAMFSHRVLLHVRASMLHESEEISLSAVTAFAETVGEWIRSNSLQHLQRGTQIMLLGSSRYVQISYNGQILIDGRAEDWERVELSPLTILPTEAKVNAVLVQNRLIIETTLPLRDQAFTSGFVRVGTFSQSLESSLRLANWTVGIIGAFGWIVCLVPIVWIAMRSIRRAALYGTPRSRPSIVALREVFAARPIVIDLRSRVILARGEPQILTPKPFGLLSLLLSDPSRVFSDQEIMDAIWPDCRYTSINDVHQCVYRLRKLLNEIEPELGLCIANVKGFGYRFQADERVGILGLDVEHASTS